MEEFRKAQTEVEKKNEKPMSQKMFKLKKFEMYGTIGYGLNIKAVGLAGGVIVLGQKVEEMFVEMLSGKGAVRNTIIKYN